MIGADAKSGGDGRAESSLLEDHVSRQLVCPISLEVMVMPVVVPSGHTYDKASIVEWLARRPVDPLSQTPLDVSSLCRNRAIHDEIVEQLEGVVERAEANGNLALREVARSKLDAVRAAMASANGKAFAPAEVPRLERLLDRCSCWVDCWLLVFVEQSLVFTTSFGAIFCLAIDMRDACRRVQRPFLLSNFVRLAVLPTVPAPNHWRLFERFMLIMLRGALLLPFGTFCSTLALGSFLSVTRFLQRCGEVMHLARDQAMQSQWLARTLEACEVVTGISTFYIFLRLAWDRPRPKQ
eukprot:TRINITY_DN51646_c0_g1_i1.p1 TRINITY_DN51646_c0_g1~~TRINITY_DN51646_c0_g1_i1.p1  ORF type:complete len:295 (+),score=43.71 TRINITY_DN51646_c0_g1_i1:140-1024(+)